MTEFGVISVMEQSITIFGQSDMLTTESLRHPTGYRTDWHAHEAGQLCRIDTGLLIIETHTGRWVIPGEHIGWIPPGQHHAALSESAIDGRSLYVDAHLCAELPAEPTVFAPEPLCDALFMRLCQPLNDASLEMLSLLTRELARAKQDRYHLPMPADPRLIKVAKSVLLAPGEIQSVDHHARHAGMSVRTFNRRFRCETGINFVNWRQLARVIQAMEWLEKGKPVGWVALSCGYNSVSAFIEVFRNYTGKTPGLWTAH